MNARACMISGNPGIGKSSTVKVIAKRLGFRILELNASDNRSKKTLKPLLLGLSTTQNIEHF
jgi:replication factor C subunit 1